MLVATHFLGLLIFFPRVAAVGAYLFPFLSYSFLPILRRSSPILCSLTLCKAAASSVLPLGLHHRHHHFHQWWPSKGTLKLVPAEQGDACKGLVPCNQLTHKVGGTH
jgi:hypothetical protein